LKTKKEGREGVIKVKRGGKPYKGRETEGREELRILDGEL